MTHFRKFALVGLMALPLAAGVVWPALVGNAEDKEDCRRDVTVVSLDSQARRMVAQDRVTATLQFEHEAPTAAAAQNKVNEMMDKALAAAGKVKGVKATTGYYNAYKQYPHEPKPLSQAEREKQATWRASQQLNLDGADKNDVLKLAGSLQEQGFAMHGLNFYLSREASDKVRDELLSEALVSVQGRAKRVASELGMPNVRMARVNVGGSGGGYPPPMPFATRGMAMKAEMAADMAAPVGQAGESEVTLSVNAEVELSR